MTTTKTVLVVEDDEALRLLVKKVLESHGYVVLHGEDAGGASANARFRGGIVDLLLADINLPGLTGGEYAEFLRSFNANLKVLYMSGSLVDGLVRTHIRNKTATFLQKPFTHLELVTAVKKALGEIPDAPEGKD